jgi:hypothetical protein
MLRVAKFSEILVSVEKLKKSISDTKFAVSCVTGINKINVTPVATSFPSAISSHQSTD